LIEELRLISNGSRLSMLPEVDSRINEFEDAIEYCTKNDPELAIRLASLIWRYWLYYGHVERGVDLLEGVTSDSESLDGDYCEALLGLGVLLLKFGRLEDAEEVLLRLVDISLERNFTKHYSIARIMISRIEADRGDFLSSKELSDEIAELSAKEGDRLTAALAMHAEAYRNRISGDLEGSVDAYQKGIAMYKEEGAHEMEFEERRNLGTVKFLMGDFYEASLILQRDDQEWVSGIPYIDAYSNIDKSILAYIEGKYEESISLVELAVSSIEDCEQRVDSDEWLLIEHIRGLAGGF